MITDTVELKEQKNSKKQFNRARNADSSFESNVRAFEQLRDEVHAR